MQNPRLINVFVPYQIQLSKGLFFQAGINTDDGLAFQVSASQE